MENPMSPSEKVITAGQAGKFADVVIARLQKSGFLHEPTQYVLEHEGVEIANVVEAEVRRRVEARIRATEPHILKRLPFDPEKFIGDGWSVDEEVSKRTGDNLDAGQITRKDYLEKRESHINGEERLKRIKATSEQDLQLDAEDFLALWQEEGQKTLDWLYETKSIIAWLSFWGTILRCPGGRRGDRYVLCLYRDGVSLFRSGGGSWRWIGHWVGGDFWCASNPAGVLATRFIPRYVLAGFCF